MPRKKKEKPQLDPELYTSTGKLRKRKRKQSRNYFTEDTENAIVEYLNTEDEVKRDRIFSTMISDSMYKLVENIINTFKFHYTGLNTIEDLKHEVVVFLYEKLKRYKKSEGKAYSYFGTIAKRYLITYNIKNYKDVVNRKELDHVDEDKTVLSGMSNDTTKQDHKHFIDSYIKYVEKNIDKHFSSDKEKEIVDCILRVAKNREFIDEFNKQIFYFQIREMTGQTTQNITKVVKNLKTIFKAQLNIYYHNGGLEIEEEDIYI